jgi:hypothetical protein
VVDFRLTDDELDVVHQFEGVKRTIVNLQRNLENVMHVSLDIRQQQSITSVKERSGVNLRSTDILDQVIETKANAVLVRLRIGPHVPLIGDELTNQSPSVVDFAGHTVAVLARGGASSRRACRVRGLLGTGSLARHHQLEPCNVSSRHLPIHTGRSCRIGRIDTGRVGRHTSRGSR